MNVYTLLCIILINRQSIAIRLGARILHPLHYNAYLGQQEREAFQCLLWGEDLRFIDWSINGERLAHSPLITDTTGILVNSSSRTNNQARSALIIPATLINSNGIFVQCVAIPIPLSAFVTSNETGHFRVQGLLNISQSSIMSTSYNLSHNEVSWERPFTLDITDVEPDIYGYTVCTLISFGSITALEECTNVVNSSFIIAKYSVTVQMTVTASNIVGESNQIIHFITPCTSSDLEFNIEATVSFKDNLTVIEFFQKGGVENENIEQICTHMFNMTIYDTSPNSTVFTEHFLFAPKTLTVQLELLLQPDSEYTAVIEDVINSENESTFYHVVFHTYNIQRIAVEILNNTLVIISCQFAQGTSALGFYAELQAKNRRIISRNVSLSNSCKQLTPQEQLVQCLATTSINLSELSVVGNFTVFVWEAKVDGEINMVYSREFSIQEILEGNTTTTISITTDNDDTVSIDGIIPGQISAATVGTISGGITGALLICLVIIISVTMLVRRANTKQGKIGFKQSAAHTSQSSENFKRNEAYDFVTQFNRNESYSEMVIRPQSTSTSEQPHVYDEITPSSQPADYSSDPHYIKVTKLSTKY